MGLLGYKAQFNISCTKAELRLPSSRIGKDRETPLFSCFTYLKKLNDI